jgi:hypothetical protein
MQTSLFDPEVIGGDACQWPDLTAASAYRYGCRCPRCRADHRQTGSPRCSFPGCDQPKARGSGRRYCPEHAVVPGAPGGAPRSVECWWCGALFVTRVRAVHPAVPVPLCPGHRLYAPVLRSWSMHHVTPDLQRAWLTDPLCWICQDPVDLTRRPPATRAPVVDHDHRCGCGKYSCGLCVRGLAHARCNLLVGHLEATCGVLGPERVLALVDALVVADRDA